MLSFNDLWISLCQGDESVLVEAKKASDIGKSVLETISAYSNEPDAGGGYLLLGVTQKAGSLFPDYEIFGIDDTDKIQCDFVTQCRDLFSCTIRPEVTVEVVNGKSVVVAYIPEAAAHQKPVFIKVRGVHKGSFRRIGPTDQLCTDEDFAEFYHARGNSSFDESVVEHTSLSDIDSQALASYRNSKGANGGSDLLRYSDGDLLYALNAASSNNGQSKLTIAGLLLFGKASALRRHLPMTRVDYIRVDGIEWVPDPERRYQSLEKLGPLLITIPQIISQILEDVPKAFNLPMNDVHRRDVPLIPRNVIREAVVNALMHRSYRNHQPVQIIRFSNRIEIKNPGYSLIPEDRLGEPGSRPRNPKIAATLHDVGLAETKGTGIRVMREAMDKANLSSPLIVSDRRKDEFTLRLLVHHLFGPEEVRWLGRLKDCNLSDDDARALIVLREIGDLDNALYRSVARVDALTASGRLRRLRDHGILEQTGKGASTTYRAGPRFLEALSPQQRVTSGRGKAGLRKESEEPLRKDLSEALRKESEALRAGLPAELAHDIAALGKRTAAKDLDDIIQRICSCRPYSVNELSLILGKNPVHLLARNLKRLLAMDRLFYVHPDKNHPDQKYYAGDFPE
jgi:ATP-dependent DNA helicase RecG